ncbi:MAG TPA: DUF929 family protein [Jatrophihabitantaceae bacterium]
MSKDKSSGAGKNRPAAPASAQQRLAAQRAAAARERIAAAQRRRRLIVTGAAIAGVIAVVAVLIVVKVVTGAGNPKSGPAATAASSTVLGRVTSVPSATFNAVGVGTATAEPIAIKSAPALTDAGKPEILYVGAEYCPYCAAERWAMAAALSRFGTLSNVGQTTSSASDVFPSTPTLSFHGATYTSKYLVFVGKETESNQVVNGHYQTLDTLTPAQQTLFSTYDAPPYVSASAKGTIPFVDIGGKYLINGASYTPQVLQGKTQQQVADALADPSSPIAQAIDGTANLITAAFCTLTGAQPADVCTSAGVTAAAAKIGAGA